MAWSIADPAARQGGAEKHKIYAAGFGGHLFNDLFLQSRGTGPGYSRLAPPPPGSAAVGILEI